MQITPMIATLERVLAAAAAPLVAPLGLATRLYVGWVFVNSGRLKVSDWPQTL
jgi:hypothetical protein